MNRKSTKKAPRSASKASRSARKSETKGKLDKKAPANKEAAEAELFYVAKSSLHGKGLFARTRLKANLTLGKLEGRSTRRDGTYVLWLTDTEGLRVTNDFRFINHSATPNCALTGTEVVTLKAVKADEELTHDYGW